jgi:hypothetical protein
MICDPTGLDTSSTNHIRDSLNNVPQNDFIHATGTFRKGSNSNDCDFISDQPENTNDADAIPIVLSNFVECDSSRSLHQPNEDARAVHSTTPAPMSPSAAVRSIVTGLIQQYDFSSRSSPKLNKRRRSDGVYGEEITRGNRLSELKENELKRKKRSPKTKSPSTTTSTDSTATKTPRSRRRTSKNNNDVVTLSLSQATSAISTLFERRLSTEIPDNI